MFLGDETGPESNGTGSEIGRLSPFPPVRQPLLDLADRHGRQVRQQLREIALRIDVVLAAQHRSPALPDAVVDEPASDADQPNQPVVARPLGMAKFSLVGWNRCGVCIARKKCGPPVAHRKILVAEREAGVSAARL